MSRSLYTRLNQKFRVQPSNIERQQDTRSRIAGFEERFDAGALLASDKPKKKLRVVVVGGGFAGLMTAYVLSRSCSVTVFEARDRVGGRVWTQIDTSGHRAIEAGAELIGYNHPTWLTLARRFDLGLTVLTTEDAFTALDLHMPLRLNGRLLTSLEAGQIHEEMAQVFFDISRNASRIVDPYKPWETPDADKLDSMSLSQWISKQHCSPLTTKALEVEFANTNGVSTARQSYLANLAAIRGGALYGKPDDYFTQSEALKCEQGNQMLAIRLAEEIAKSGSSVVTSAPVKHIEVLRDYVAVRLARGDVVEADYVILAIPPSLWPSDAAGDIEINPQIPREFHMSMGVAVKYLSEVKGRFWLGSGLSPNAVSEAIGMTWDGTDNQVQLNDQCVELSLFAGGAAAKAALNLLDRRGTEDLDAFYAREIEGLYQGYASNRLRQQFVGWPRERWTGAGYSCPAPG